MSDEAIVAAQRADALTLTQKSVEAAQGLAQSGADIAAKAERLGKVAFVAPVQRWYRVLVNPNNTKPVSFPDKDSPRGQKMVERDNDVFLEFKDGIAVLDPNDAEDILRIEWCEAHEDVCRNANDPMTEAWASMKEAQTATAQRDPILPPSMDINAALRGDPAGYSQPGSTVERAKESLANA